MTLNVQNGYPVYEGPNRASATPDYDTLTQHYYDLGTALADDYGLAAAFQELYGTYTAYQGKAPSAAFDEALRVLDIVTADDFIIIEDRG